MKKILAVISALVCVSQSLVWAPVNAFAETENKVPVLKGDVDLDNSITSVDSLITLRLGVKLEDMTELRKKLSDVNGDGSVDSYDSLRILRYSVGLEQSGSIGASFTVDSAIYPADGNWQNTSESAQAQQPERLPIPTGESCRIFKKVVCCGDSYTAGLIVDPDNNVHSINEDYAWPRYMSDITGNSWINCGQSGATVLIWQKVSRGLMKAKSVGKTQAYVIGLGINDAGHTANWVPLGTPQDVGTQAQTYYGGMSQIIEQLNAISPKAKIFVNTQCRTGSVDGRKYSDYNQAVRNIVEIYREKGYPIHCIDLEAHAYMYTDPVLDPKNPESDYLRGHYTAIGYERFAENYKVILGDYINHHIKEFQDVPFIEYDP